jgi:ATP-dependent Clp protease ATP-binding subunit ClpA
MARLIQTELKDPIADQVLFGELQKGGVARVEAGPDGLVITCEGRGRG